ncbi:MAG: ABC transporter ATP-binding protein, partial [Candidatus Methanomethylicota archaeon]
MSELILEVQSLTKCFGALRAVDGVSMKFQRQKLTLIIGPNGSGKTTLINCISGIYKPDGGRVIYGGEDITDIPPHERVKKGLVRTFQIPMPFQRLTVLENLLVGYQHNPGEGILNSLFKNKWIKSELTAVEKAFEILVMLKLDHLWDRPAHEL